MDKTILLVASGSWDAGLIFSYKRAFESYGFRVEQFDLDAARRASISTPRFLDPVVQRLLPYIDVASAQQKADRELFMRAYALRPAIVLVTCNEGIRASTLMQLKVGLPETKVINVFPDALFNMRANVVQGLPMYDLFCTHTRAGLEYLERFGCKNAFYVPLAADPTLHKPLPLTPADEREYGCDVVYVGNWRPEHEELFSHLEGLSLHVWGSNLWTRAKSGWVRSRWRGRPLLTGEQYAKAHIAAKVCLNPIDPLNLPGHNQRVFELPACRVFSLVTRTEDTTTLFEEGKTIECFASAKEMVDKVHAYLKRPDDRARIADAAYRHVIEGGHTYRDRVEVILDRLGIPA